jgi:hypothetical protein
MGGNVGNVKDTEVYPASVDFFEFCCSELFILGKGFYHIDVILAIRERFPFLSYLVDIHECRCSHIPVIQFFVNRTREYLS